MSGYYLTAEPVGVCTCHACTCDGSCPECDPTAEIEDDRDHDDD